MGNNSSTFRHAGYNAVIHCSHSRIAAAPAVRLCAFSVGGTDKGQSFPLRYRIGCFLCCQGAGAQHSCHHTQGEEEGCELLTSSCQHLSFLLSCSFAELGMKSAAAGLAWRVASALAPGFASRPFGRFAFFIRAFCPTGSDKKQACLFSLFTVPYIGYISVTFPNFIFSSVSIFS